MKNLEVKCRYPDHRRAARLAHEQLDARLFCRIQQTDTYLAAPHGRLKLCHDRCGAGESWELIAYQRPNQTSPRTSSYKRVPLSDGPALREVLAGALGVLVCVRKVRRVYLAENIRVHLDTVQGLGRFLEFELIVSARHPLQSCRRRVWQLLERFGIEPADLIGVSYSDLLLNAPGHGGGRP